MGLPSVVTPPPVVPKPGTNTPPPETKVTDLPIGPGIGTGNVIVIGSGIGTNILGQSITTNGIISGTSTGTTGVAATNFVADKNQGTVGGTLYDFAQFVPYDPKIGVWGSPLPSTLTALQKKIIVGGALVIAALIFVK
jgi:hypothetical protein